MKNALIALGFIFTFIFICAVGAYLDEKIDSIDDAVFQHMKDEFNRQVGKNEE